MEEPQDLCEEWPRYPMRPLRMKTATTSLGCPVGMGLLQSFGSA